MSAQNSQGEGVGVWVASVYFAGPSACFVVENHHSCLDLFFYHKGH